MRVLFIVPSLRRAGAETQVIDLVNGLDPQRFEKHLLSFGEELQQRDRVDDATVRFHHILRQRKLDFTHAAHIAKLIDEHAIDVVHCTLQISLFIARLALRQSKRQPRLVVAIHTTLNRSAREEILDRIVFRPLIRACEKVVFVCHAQAQHWVKKFPELRARHAVVYNGVDQSWFRPGQDTRDAAAQLRRAQGIPADAPVITCIAGFRDEKGHPILLDAFARLRGEPWLMLAGDGPERGAIEARIATLGIGNRVCLLGERDDIRSVIAASSLTVLASTAVETFSMAMLESMAMAVPVVATDIGGLAEAVEPGKTGAIVPPGDAAALAMALQAFVDDDSMRQACGERALARVTQQFSLAAMVAGTAALLERPLRVAAETPAQ